jgi:miniconductance mechanosensitive channel
MRLLYKYFLEFFRQIEGLDYVSKPLAALLMMILILIVAWLSFQISKFIVNRIISRVARRTKTDWDDIMYRNKVFIRLAHLIPAFIVYQSSGFSLPLISDIAIADAPTRELLSQDHYFQLAGFINDVVKIYLLIVVVLVSNSFLNSVNEIFNKTEFAHHRPINGYIQIVRIFIIFIAAILAISVVLDKDPTVLLAGLGAMAAVLILIFKDTILGFVASIQLSANDMLKIGDWVEIPKNNTNGNVTDITLNTVKIRNFDNSISTVPTYSLVSESFINWKGLEIAEGRRIKRAVSIDMTSIKFCSNEMLLKFSEFELIHDYVLEKQKEIEDYNLNKGIQDEDILTGRKQTNIGIFRNYLEKYLAQHPMVNKDLPLVVRQLESTGKGLPIEVYLFCNDKTWANFEMVQADIFDHIFAVIPVFELKLFQDPSTVKLIT